MTRQWRSVGVVGLGTMGAGIAEVFARGGLDVTAVEINEDALARGRSTLIASVDRAHAKGRLSAAERESLLGRVRFATGLAALDGVDLVVEAVPERLDLKRTVFAELDRICRPDTILATNTSSLSVTEVAVTTGRPEQVVGLHFFNPAPVMKLVEVIRTVVTSEDVVADVQQLCHRLGKVAVTVADRAGFVANALLFGYLNDAVAMFDSRYATREDIDTAMRLGAGFPMGPLTLLDLIGLDTAYEILDTVYRRGGRDRRYAPAPLLRQMVTAGMLGRKSGQGFYTYEQPSSPVVVADALTPTLPAADGAREVRTVGVVGSGAPADALAEALAQGGYEVVPLAGDPAAPAAPGPVAAADLVVVATAAAGTPVIDCAMATERPSDVVGMHLLPGGLVEVVHTVRSAPDAIATARAVVAAAGLTGVTCPDRSGFIVGALLWPYLNDAVRMLEIGYATPDDIDAAMTLGCGYPTGPVAMLDALGPGNALAMLRAIYRERREPGLAPAALLEQLVTAGRPFRTAAAPVRRAG